MRMNMKYSNSTSKTAILKTNAETSWFRVECNFDTDKVKFSYSTDGEKFTELGLEYIMAYQLKTFQGVRFALFNYNTSGKEGGYVDFNSFDVYEPRCKGLTKPIPYNLIQIASLADNTLLVNWRNFLRPLHADNALAKGKVSHFKVLDRGNGRIALQSVATGDYVTVKGLGGLAEVRIEANDQGKASTFQWQDMLRGDLMLMSLETHQYLFVDAGVGSLCSADAKGARPDRKGGACFKWTIVE